MSTKKTQLRVWWIPQVPGKAFHVPVGTASEASRVMDILARYDQFQFDNRIKPDYANVGGLQQQVDGGEWEEWSDADGRDIDELRALGAKP